MGSGHFSMAAVKALTVERYSEYEGPNNFIANLTEVNNGYFNSTFMGGEPPYLLLGVIFRQRAVQEEEYPRIMFTQGARY